MEEEEEEEVEASDLLDIASEVLSQMGISGKATKLTYVFKTGEEWRVNFSYTESDKWYESQAAFKVDAHTGDIIGMWTDRLWK